MIERKRSNNSIYLVENGQSETRPNILRPLEKTNSLQKKSNGVTVYCSMIIHIVKVSNEQAMMLALGI